MIARALAAVLLCAACSRGGTRVSAPAAEIDVIAASHGLSAEDAHRRIAIPIARAMTQQGGVAHVVTTSDGREVRVRVLLAGGDPDAASQRVAGALQDTSALLPEDVGPPQIERHLGGPTIRVIVRGALAITQLRTWVDWQLRREIETIAGVDGVSTCGGAIAEIEVRIDAARANAMGIGVDQVLDEAARSDVLPAGSIDTGGRSQGFVVRAIARRSIDDLRDAVIADRAGAPIRLGDVATIQDDGAPDPCESPDPRGGILTDVHLRRDADAQAIADAIRSRADAPPGVTLQLVHAPVRYHVALAADPGVDLRALAAAWRGALAATPGVIDVARAPGVDVAYTIDRPACARAGVDLVNVQRAIAAASGGVVASTYYEATSSRDVRVSVPHADLAAIPVRSGDGVVPLASLAARAATGTPARIDGLDGAPAIVIDLAIGADQDHPDAIAAPAVDAARKAAPPPANVRVATWREP